MTKERSTYTVYMLLCADGSLYTGITTDVERRLAEHKAGTGGHYTRAKKVDRLLYTEVQPNRSLASKREAEIKSWSREEKNRFLKSR
ncbi:MAG: endonuclease [Candidatus Taylorbacteria bacterium CG11_big_fil_rev_8_21_14_0_20_46_11]|uniref:Endonuclease n=1 Tax=Candidatus Taylorbacteria bacterium CG11_big_fil_rev_8_21_14_0_20_46_11 TaxID=1975025 RepID=A0A2H0KBN0_9BACT|nr:MAG: endonuclease [Candidatus Taylorbacteria bacterium CG11_big_fil_rev_8_21_14_0_20_46_11]